ncbi:glycosyltransferase family 4 protein [Jannaschia seohaensis]|uniref:Glycosyltransferase involved in cell wall biosynthesis n=1 Tax=Jannaschia seohaensis TaxID=475081 RepID=A0A2Y9A3A8_9RHOB|nr:glycosyltransferase family 4 protein [Jannaschia seohaensis]PWJ22437.1 glycosyltransferase involved in cell wall biosynthesis [Jannaschia seohaensis]SSA38715.1 Glycosyltransferase involved in cell wall bisynthesis [Jannaschia seohaensis]
MRPAAFAIPGDINTVTGGYIYERRLLMGLRDQGRDVQHLQLAAAFPDPSAADMAAAIDALADLPPERALILDGLVFGAIDTAGLARVRAPIVAMIHHPLALETGLSAARHAHLFRTERDNLRLARHVLVPSPHTADILAGDYATPRSRITIAPPGTDARPRRRHPIDPPLILSVGLQHPRKGHDVLLRALARLTHLPWRAVIAGSAHDPEHAALLARMVEELDLGARVHLAGRVPNAELDALYAEATLFTLATRYEGYGMVFDEALTWGLPIVACATGAVPQTVPEGTGRLVPPDDPGALAQAVTELLTDLPARDAMAARAAAAGAALPGWDDTARIAGEVLDGL